MQSYGKMSKSHIDLKCGEGEKSFIVVPYESLGNSIVFKRQNVYIALGLNVLALNQDIDTHR